MKCIAVVALFALVAVALAKPLETESIEPANSESLAPEADLAARNKRGLLPVATNALPLAATYSRYSAPLTYSPYSYPYTVYSGYPYYALAYQSPYYVV